ncbi:MAG: gamma carbonic anhydrase family protein [Negativicutes bacterium]|nr:gamma carbonic anhydrase family protein [Negativicutes bacterium]
MKSGSLIPFRGHMPRVDDQVFLAEGCKVIGDVEIGLGSGVWFNAVIRGDVNFVRIGAYSNIQDGALVHVHPGTHPAAIGDYVTIGHQAVVHGCTVGNNCLIGMGAIIMDGVVIGDNSLIGAGTLLTEKKVFPANALLAGSPGRVVRKVSDAEIAMIRQSALHYYELSLEYTHQTNGRG